jgi:hypothetical protein
VTAWRKDLLEDVVFAEQFESFLTVWHPDFHYSDQKSPPFNPTLS